MRHLIAAVLLLAVTCLPTRAQIVSLGACPYVPDMHDFRPEKYGGLWYEQEKYPFVFELGGKCITAEYSLNADKTLTVVNRQVNILTGNEQKVYGSARRTGPSTLQVKFPVSFNIEAPYKVVHTDYMNYAVVFSCIDLGLIHTKTVWILTRDRYPKLDVKHNAYSAMSDAKLNPDYLTRTDQNHCESEGVTHVKVPMKTVKDPPKKSLGEFKGVYSFKIQPLKLLTSLLVLLAFSPFQINAQIASLGVCQHVPKLHDFYPEKFAGLWYEQERYPFVFELAAKCVTSEYSLNADETFTITNRQINSITGNEKKLFGSARRTKPSKFQVKFPVALNQETPYWIIGTDYHSYAVVYSCTEVGLINTKNVWILTRERFPTKETIREAYFVLDNAKLNRALLQYTDQKNCDPVRKIVHKVPRVLVNN